MRISDWSSDVCSSDLNGELWGRPTTVPWAIIFPRAGDLPRHPSQLYEAGLEGILMFALLAFFFWRPDARYKPGFLFGLAAILYGLSRFSLEFVREPDVQLGTLRSAEHTSELQSLMRTSYAVFCLK